EVPRDPAREESEGHDDGVPSAHAGHSTALREPSLRVDSAGRGGAPARPSPRSRTVIHDNVLSAIGDTPLVRLNRVASKDGATVLAKLEFMNPGGSIKDRMALFILDKAGREGRIQKGCTIVENTSGNTGVGVALWAAVRGYPCVFTMPDKMSKE